MTAKRPAFELPAALLAPPEHNPQMRRPTATVVGTALVFLRIATGALWLISVWANWPHLLDAGWLSFSDDSTISGSELAAANVALPILIGAGVLVLLVDLVLAVLIYRGSNVARVIVMSVSVISLSSAFAAWWASGQEINLRTTLLTTASDVLVLLALSSREAAAYARRNETDREPRGVMAA